MDWRKRNPAKCAQYARTTRKRHYNSSIRPRLKTLYDITPEYRDQMIAAQNGKCAVCGRIPKKMLHVDHNHTTGKVREMLCAGCNTAIGLLKESPELIAKVLAYLAKHS